MINNENKQFRVLKKINIFGIALFLTASTLLINSSTKSNSFKAKADSQTNEIALSNDEMYIDITSLTKTSTSRTATLSFNSTRLTGWGTSKKNAYSIIEDDDYSGTKTSPSISNTKNPIFNGEIAYLADVSTYSETKTEGSVKITTNYMVIPSKLTYGDYFSIQNNKILKDSFIFSTAEDYQTKLNYIVIPSSIQYIESKAFQNVPKASGDYLGVLIKCQATSKPEGWANDWCDADASNIEWGYSLSEKDNKYLSQATGTNIKYFGKRVKTAASADLTSYSAVNDANWSGDFDNPVKTSVGLTTPYHLKSDVLEANVATTLQDLVIPSTLKYSESLILDNVSIQSNFFDFASKEYSNCVKNIYIPNTIKTVGINAFTNVPNGVHFYCEAEKPNDYEQPIGWNENWIKLADKEADKKTYISWGYQMPVSLSDKINTTVNNIDTEIRLADDGLQYILGYKYTRQDLYYCESCQKYCSGNVCEYCQSTSTFIKDETPEFNLPLKVTYDILKNGTYFKTVEKELPLSSEEETSSSTSAYDSVKNSPLTRSFDILLDDGESLDQDSFVVHNIYRSTSTKKLIKYVKDGHVESRVSTFYYPDTSVTFKCNARKRFDQEIDINNVIRTSYSGINTFSDYFVFDLNVQKVLNPRSYWYELIDADVLASNQVFLDNGDYSIRYAFYELTHSYYKIEYLSNLTNTLVSKVIPIKAASSVAVIENEENIVSFLIHNSDIGNDFNPKNIKRFDIIGLTIEMHLWNNSKANKVSRTSVSIHFGSLRIFDETMTVKIFSVDKAYFILSIIYFATYIAAFVVLFFTLKEKYKNDEFRRLKPKDFIKKGIIGCICGFIVYTSIVFIIFRCTKFANSIPVHNPLDAFIVIPSVISIVCIGYFVKFVVNKIKSNKKRKENIRLKLNMDVDEDGTK